MIEPTIENCIFCKIIKGEIPSYKVYEDKDFLAFLDIRPLNPGHTLVVPKKHHRWVWDEEPKLIGEHMKLCQKIAHAQQKALNTEWIILDIAGMGVLHSHIHIIPRFENDGHGEFVNLKNIKDLPKEEMIQITKKIATFL